MAISVTERSSFLLIIYYLLALSFTAFQFQLGSSRFSPNFLNLTSTNAGTTFILHLSGNVYPDAYYSALLDIGQPPKTFDFDMDTGSDLTWVKCDAPKTMEENYKPKEESFVRCGDPICKSAPKKRNQCRNPNDKCNYEAEYLDTTSSSGFLVTDNFPLRLTNGTVLSPRLVFGCGIKQYYPEDHPKQTAGMLGLTDGKISILSQLHSAGIIKNVAGHCLATKGGGYMFLGDVPAVLSSSNIAWVPRISSSLVKDYYSAGPAELFHSEKPTRFKGLQIIFDSGSTYTSMTSELYRSVVDQVKEDLKSTPLKKAKVHPDDYLKVCWTKGKEPIKSVGEVKGFFKPFMLRFANNKQIQIPPEAYIIVDKEGDVCLGILPLEDGTGGIILGDIVMQDMMMIFDNEKKQIGWVSADCTSIPKS